MNVEKPTFKKICKMYIQQLTNFPYIEKDFDALTDYGLLCKVVDYLNQVIENNNTQNESITNLYNAFVTLKDYVDNYFENLDVQEEINNKLDAMAQSGELTTLISAYIDPIYQAYENEINGIVDSQNSRITSVEDALQGVASGSPAGVYNTVADLTQADPDHSRTYVVSADGKWYYYDTTQETWVAGGIYQASEGGDNFQILTNKVDLANLNIYDETMSSLGIITNTGIVSSTINKHAEVPVTVGETYYLYRKSQTYARNGDYFGFIDGENTVFGITSFGDNIVQYHGIKFVKITIPENAAKLVFNTKLNSFDDVKSSILFTKPSSENLKGYDLQLRNYIDNFNSNYNLNIENKVFIFNYMVAKATNEDRVAYYYDSRTTSVKQNLTAGETYYLYRKSQAYSVLRDVIAFYNSSDEVISYIVLANSEQITLINGEKVVKFTAPENVSYCRYNMKLSTFYDETYTGILSKIPTEYPILANDLDLRNYVEENLISEQPALKNRLRGKKWLTLGDSITALTYRSTKNYHDYIAERTGIIVTNQGDSGKGYVQGYTSNKSMCDYVDNLTGEEDFDYITIFAGTNDRSYSIGTFNNGDKTTIYGAVQYCITELIRKFPNVKIGILTPLPRATNYGTESNNKLYQIVNVEVDVANYYSIPVLNQYISSGLRPWNADNNETYFSCEVSPQGDGLHPNELGHEWISYPIQEFLQTL